MQLRFWRIDPETTNTHCVGVRSITDVCLGADETEAMEFITAFVRWDGCTFITDGRPYPYHLCDLDEEIGRWQELKAIALAYFGGEFHLGGRSEDEVAAFIREALAVEGTITRPDTPLLS